MNIVEQPWYPKLVIAAQETAKDVYQLVKNGGDAEFDEAFAQQHDFFDAFPSAFGDDEEEMIEFDWNANLALLWICGLRPVVEDTEAGKALLWLPKAGYSEGLVFRQAYMDATVELQNLFFEKSEYAQRSFLTILEKLSVCHKIWRSDEAPEHQFVFEYAVVPNQPLIAE
jgi:hypothetical protein